jgi:hypothetical protein
MASGGKIQGHICGLPEDHVAGLGCLQGITQFSKEVVEKLAIFQTNGRPGMMGKVLKAAASRMKVSGKTAVRVKVSVQGWEDPATMDLPGENLVHLTRLARVVGAELIVEEVECSRPIGGRRRYTRASREEVEVYKSLKVIVSHMENQKKPLAYTEFNHVHLGSSTEDDLCIRLLKVSKKWKVGEFVTLFAPSEARFPTDVLAAGQIDQMRIWKGARGSLEVVRRFWEITAQMIIYSHAGGGQETTVGGGKRENPDADWQRVLDILEDDDEDNDCTYFRKLTQGNVDPKKEA